MAVTQEGSRGTALIHPACCVGSEAGNELEKLSSEDASSDHEAYGGSISNTYEEEKDSEDRRGRLIT